MSKKKQPFIIGTLSIALIAICVLSLNFNKQSVYAVGTGVEIVTPVKVDYQVESHKDINEYRVKDALKAPVFSGEHPEKWVFAGWFKDIDCTLGVSSGLLNKGNNNIATGTYYAKYVSADVLSAKVQITTGTTSETDTVLRCVSTVDSLKYNKVGMDLVTPYGGEDAVKHMEKSKVSKEILSRTDVNMGEYSYSPKVMDTESEYFFSATEPVANEYFDDGFSVKPYWITKDGTKVYGVSRYVVIDELLKLQNGETANIYVPVKTEKPAQGATFTVNEVSSITSVAYDAEGGYAHLAVSVDTLQSATLYTIKNANGSKNIGTYIYRNLLTKYNGSTADTSWYTLYTDEDEYVVATSADLYGIAGAVTTEGAGFKDKTIYVVSDIKANVGYANKTNLTWETTKSADGEALPTGTDGTSYEWTGIGTSAVPFAGNFDGQGHEISGIYINSSAETNTGLFKAINTSGTIKDFKIRNSYITSIENNIGSVVGNVTDGRFFDIFSDAIVASTATGANVNKGNVGGFIGYLVGNVTMDNCWFKGSVTNRQGQVNGGLIGRIDATDKNITITNCLNTGTITTYTTHKAGSYTGGLVGFKKNGYLNLKYCLNAGTIDTNGNVTRRGLLIGEGQQDSHTQVHSITIPDVDATKITLKHEASTIYGTDALTSMPLLFAEQKGQKYESYWAIVPNGTPILSAFGEYEEKGYMEIDTRWYDGSKASYTLEDAGDLYGLALLSQKTEMNGFVNKTFILTKDIQINAGTPKGTDGEMGTDDDWSKDAPDYNWIAIGDASGTAPRFAGTFDGKDSKGVIHKISGLYMNTTSKYQGLFAGTAASAKIKNFRLEDSYFHGTEEQLGSIVGNAMGEFHTIYSNAIIEGSAGASKSYGGFIGSTSSSGGVTMTNCWFDGTLSNTAVATNYYGGLIGLVYNNSTVSNCLNTGKISLTVSTGPRVGGLVGTVTANGSKKTLTITNSCNMGEIGLNASVNKYYGLLVGAKESADDTITVSNSYAIKQDNIKLVYNAEDSSFANCQVLTSVEGADALTLMPNLFITETEDGKYESYWAVVPGGHPILSAFGKHEENGYMEINTRWYDGSKATYTLKDAGDLYGFSLLSQKKELNGFEGKTIQMEKDITINEATSKEEAEAWAADAPKYKWIPIGHTEKDYAFKGTFDGELHTINGLYVYDDTTKQMGGLFARTDSQAVVKNLKLTNSYIYGSTRRIGSIAGYGNGTFSDIYSNATVVCEQKHTGGLVGIVSGEITMSNCWFDGTVINKGMGVIEKDDGTLDYHRATGGLIGYVYTGKLKMSNCLNSGLVDASAYQYDQNSGEEVQVIPLAGGLVGYAGTDVEEAKIYDCLNVGEVRCHETATSGYSPILGYETRKGQDNMETVVEIVRTYATTQCEDTSNVSGMVAMRETSAITGSNAATEMPLLDWDVQWKTTENGFPEIRFSQTGFVGDESRVVDAGEVTTLSDYYAERTLYQGEMHDHAANEGASDGTVTLADWLEQMPDLQLDFAASLDHHMVSHFDGETWKNNRDKLLYGTEAGTIISGVTATGESVSYHYNMIFPNRADFVKVLTSEKFASKFQYDGTKHEVKYGDKVTYGEFQYPSFDSEKEFQELIQLVKSNNGFFGLAHPVVSHPYSPESVDDYYFADETGFEVIYGTLRDGNTSTAYKAWKQLLTKGYRLWATAGKDGHENLSTDALTSIYAKKTETENYLSEAFVRNLRQGNFTAGAVGIQMCVGDTQMGGTGSFEGKKLEIGIGEIHQDHFDSTHEYRVDVWYEDSVVYTTRIQRDSANEMTYISMDAEPNCRYYRVVVYDATSKTRVAIGNPIWNSTYYPSDN